MEKESEPTTRGPSRGITRREVIAGGAIAVLAASAPAAFAQPAGKRKDQAKLNAVGSPLRRYMAAAAVLGDGRLLISGGYDRPWKGEAHQMPLNSAVIYDPANDSYSQAAPMALPRARHAAVALSDGRIAVLGGMSLSSTASVEIYDPRSNTWETGPPMQQPRYDHAAAASGGAVYVMGGSSATMLASLEIYDPTRKAQGLSNSGK
jgi:hypothetical protein